MAIIISLLWSIDSGDGFERLYGSISCRRGDGEFTAVHEIASDSLGHALDGERFVARESQARCALSGEELQWQDAHSDEVGAVDALITFGDGELDAQKIWSLCGPISA